MGLQDWWNLRYFHKFQYYCWVLSSCSLPFVSCLLQEIRLLMLLAVPTMLHPKCCGNVMVQRLMFGVLGLLSIFCWVGSLHFGMVRIPRFIWVFFDYVTCLLLINILLQVPSFADLFYFDDTETEQGIFEQVLRGDLDFVSDPWPSISNSAKDLIRKMLVRDSKKRLTAHEVLCKLFFFLMEY